MDLSMHLRSLLIITVVHLARHSICQHPPVHTATVSKSSVHSVSSHICSSREDHCEGVQGIKMASAVSDRIVGAIVGSLVAEAAGAPLHWIYDPKVIKTALEGHDNPEFLPQSKCPFYALPSGRNGCVGEQAHVLMQSLIESKGFDAADFKLRMYKAFGPDSDYEVDLGHPVTKADWPLAAPWRPGHLKAFVMNFEEKEEPMGNKEGPNGDAHGKLVPLVALYAGRPELPSLVETATRITHNNDLSVNSALAVARVLEQYILEGDVSATKAVEKVHEGTTGDVADSISAVLESKSMDHHEAVQKFQSHCGYPPSLQTSLHAVLTSSDPDFASAIRPTLTAAGDNLPRLMTAGACVGARVGPAGIPKTWLDKTLKGVEIVEQAKKLAELRETL